MEAMVKMPEEILADETSHLRDNDYRWREM